MSVLDERPIHRVRKPVYEMSLSIYPKAICGEDLQTGSPVKVSDTGDDPYVLKRKVGELILSVVPCDGECLVEMLMMKDGRYFDRDEAWFDVDREQKKVSGRIL